MLVAVSPQQQQQSTNINSINSNSNKDNNNISKSEQQQQQQEKRRVNKSAKEIMTKSKRNSSNQSAAVAAASKKETVGKSFSSTDGTVAIATTGGGDTGVSASAGGLATGDVQGVHQSRHHHQSHHHHRHQHPNAGYFDENDSHTHGSGKHPLRGSGNHQAAQDAFSQKQEQQPDPAVGLTSKINAGPNTATAARKSKKKKKSGVSQNLDTASNAPSSLDGYDEHPRPPPISKNSFNYSNTNSHHHLRSSGMASPPPPPPAIESSSFAHPISGSSSSSTSFNPRNIQASLMKGMKAAAAAGAAAGGGNGDMAAQRKSDIWYTSDAEEKQRIRDFWLGLDENGRRSLVQIERDAVLKKIKEQQRHNCSCSVCGKRRTVIEQELEMLYDAYYQELEQFAVTLSGNDTSSMSSSQKSKNGKSIGPLPPSSATNSKQHSSMRGSSNPYVTTASPSKPQPPPSSQPPPPASSISHPPNGRGGGIVSDLGSSLLVKAEGGILTLADDFLRNDGRKFLELMEDLADRKVRMLDEDEMGTSDDEWDDEDDLDDDEIDEEGDEDDEEYSDEEEMTEEERIEEGRRMFQIFAAKMFEQRVLTAYREKVAQDRAMQLLQELEEEESQKNKKEEAKQKQREKKKAQKKAQKQQKEEERIQKEREKQLEEDKARLERERKAEEDRARREAERLKKEEERIKKEEVERARREAERSKREEEQRKKDEAEKQRKGAERLRKEEEKKRQREAEERKQRAKAERERQERERLEQERKAEALRLQEAAMKESAAVAAADPHARVINWIDTSNSSASPFAHAAGGEVVATKPMFRRDGPFADDSAASSNSPMASLSPLSARSSNVAELPKAHGVVSPNAPSSPLATPQAKGQPTITLLPPPGIPIPQLDSAQYGGQDHRTPHDMLTPPGMHHALRTLAPRSQSATETSQSMGSPHFPPSRSSVPAIGPMPPSQLSKGNSLNNNLVSALFGGNNLFNGGGQPLLSPSGLTPAIIPPSAGAAGAIPDGWNRPSPTNNTMLSPPQATPPSGGLAINPSQRTPVDPALLPPPGSTLKNAAAAAWQFPLGMDSKAYISPAGFGAAPPVSSSSSPSSSSSTPLAQPVGAGAGATPGGSTRVNWSNSVSSMRPIGAERFTVAPLRRGSAGNNPGGGSLIESLGDPALMAGHDMSGAAAAGAGATSGVDELLVGGGGAGSWKFGRAFHPMPMIDPSSFLGESDDGLQQFLGHHHYHSHPHHQHSPPLGVIGARPHHQQAGMQGMVGSGLHAPYLGGFAGPWSNAGN